LPGQFLGQLAPELAQADYADMFFVLHPIITFPSGY
jgi:hypothetical protein